MDERFDDYSAFFNRRTDKIIISKRFADRDGKPMRIMSKIVDTAEALKFVKIGTEKLIHKTPAGRQNIKATLFEDDRGMTVLTLQKYSRESALETHFSFVGSEITTLLEFVAGIRTVPLPDSQGRHVTDEEMREIVLGHSQLANALANKPEVITELLKKHDFDRDLIAVGYRRAQLQYFERLLGDKPFFEAERESKGVKAEALWQSFFEANKWIFGYGLSFQFLGSLDGKALEQMVSGSSVSTAGKRVDALMKTHGAVNALCFVEIKRHDTPLLESTSYRSGAWAPSKELAGGVTQLQTTVELASKQIGSKLRPTNDEGSPTGEELFGFDPKSFLVIGTLEQLNTEQGPNEEKFRSFELYRRNTRRPEIVTFDELYHRAKFIVQEAD